MADHVSQPLIPDLYAGGAANDANHRILARLERGGALPPPSAARRRNPLPRTAYAALAAITATLAAVWLLAHRQPTRPDPVFAVRASVPSMPPQEIERRAAAIVNEPLQARVERGYAHNAPAAGYVVARHAAPASSKPAPPKKPVLNKEPDDDVTLLAAMLAHASRTQAAASQPPGK